MFRRTNSSTVSTHSAKIAFFATCLFIFALANAIRASSGSEMKSFARPELKLLAETPSSTSLSFQALPLSHEEVWSQGERFDQFAFEDDPPTGPEGWPGLPSMVRFVLIPPESGVELAISNVRSHTLQNINPYPHQPLALEEQPEAIQASAAPESGAPLIRDSRADEVEGFWPPEIAKLDRPAIMRGYRIVPIVINPVRYNPKTRELQVIDDFNIELNYATGANRVNLVRNSERYQTSSAIRSLLNETVVNPLRDEPQRDAGRLGGSVVYVLGTGNHWDPVNEAIQPLVTWRRQMGYPTEALRVEDVTHAASVKQALLTAYQEWEYPPEFIVLVGDGNFDFIVGWFDVRGDAGNPYESDHGFACLDGDDLWPDAAVGRLAFRDVNMLRGIVRKIIQYEKEPYIGDGDLVGWQKRAAFAATEQRNGTSSIDVCRWSKTLVLSEGYTDVGELYWTPDNPRPNPTDFINQQFRSGISVFAFRGWVNLNGFTNPAVNQLQNGRMLPFVILATCNTNNFAQVVWGDDYNYCDRFIHYTGGGAIGAVGTSGSTHTAYNNLVVSGILRDLFLLGVSNQGWATTLGKTTLIRHYEGRGDINHPNGDEMWRVHLQIYNLMGDPATDLYTDVPRMLSVTGSEDLRIGDTYVDLNVLHADDNSPALDAEVCLFKNGAFQLVQKPDADGNVNFNLDPEWTQNGSVLLTVTGHNLFTVVDTLRVVRAEQFVGASGFSIDDDNNGASRGNSDGVANPLETLELAVQVTNLTQHRPEGELNLRLTADSPEVTVDQDAARFDAAPDAGRSVTANFVVTINGGFPSGQDAVLHLTAAVGDESWASSVLIPVEGPKYEFDSFQWRGNPLQRGGSADLFIQIRNVGQVDGPPLHAMLLSRTLTVQAVNAEGEFAELQVDSVGRSGAPFALSAHPFHLGGKSADLALALESDAGFRDTVNFSIATAPAVVDEPFGPDAYGYLCFDDTDSGWFAVPEYDWVELNPNVGGAVRGATNTELMDTGEDDDTSTVVDLPFIFMYYGREFDHVTISSNGWLAAGDCHELNLFNNRTMPGASNAPGMIAPFWDDLITPQNSGIYTFYDDAQHRFIVEWSQVRRLGPRGNQEASETFEAILYDPDFWPSFTGDGDIVFQYRDVTDGQSCFQAYDTPFATVGISSPDLSTGLQYTYWNSLSAGAAPLEDGRAIKFATLVEFRGGVIHGLVYDAATREPIAGASINARFGFRTVTDENGEFWLSDVLADSIFALRVSAQFYNDSILTNLDIRQGDTLDVEIGLLHPEFTHEADSIGVLMTRDSTTIRVFSMQNTGNGWLAYNSRFVFEEDSGNIGGGVNPAGYKRDEPDEPFRLLRRWALSDSLFNPQIQSVIFAQDHWIIAAGRQNVADSLDYFYFLDREGRLIGQIAQPFHSRLGFRDMEFYRGTIWATNLDTAIYRIDPETGRVMAYWNTPRPLTSSRCITFNPANGHVFLSSTTGNIYEYRFERDTLREVRTFENVDPRDQTAIRKSGFGWFRDDPDGFPLYITSFNEYPVDVTQADISIYKMNPNNGEIRFVTRLPEIFEPQAGARTGMTITTKWNSQIFVLATIIESGQSDEMAIFELAPNTSWITYAPHADTLQAGEAGAVDITIETAGLEVGSYRATIEFMHNARPGFFRLPVGLRVVSSLEAPIIDDSGAQADAFELRQNFPNPFNQQTRIAFNLESPSVVKLTVWDVSGREVGELVDEPMEAGRHVALWNAEGLPAGIYLTRLEAGGHVAVRKTILLK